MFNDDTDKEWEKFGRQDPYYGVLTNRKFRSDTITDELRDEFFASGRHYVDRLIGKVHRFGNPDFRIRRAIDFGCGVGRLAIPLARHCDEVTGIDVSAAMLQEARNNCADQGVDNVVLVQFDDSLSALEGTYDFIHSFIVFQHIPVKRGERIFAGLLERLETGGIGVVHFNFDSTHRFKWLHSLVTRAIPYSGRLINLLKGKSATAPRLQMNDYSIKRLLQILQQAGATCFHAEFTDHGGELGIVLYVRKD